MPKNPRKKKRLRRRDIERLENTSAVGAVVGPSDECTCANGSCGATSTGCVASCGGNSAPCNPITCLDLSNGGVA